MFNEVLAHSAGADFIELPPSAAAVDLSGCILTDAPGLSKFTFPAGSSIAAKGLLSLPEGQLGFAPHATGDTLYFLSPDAARVLDAVRFGAQEQGVSSGRFPDGAGVWKPLTALTPGAPNPAALRAAAVISEIMFQPVTGSPDDEYIELQNPHGGCARFGGLGSRGEADFEIPAGTAIPGGGRLVIAKNPVHLMAAYQGLTPANTAGPFSGTLSDRAGRISLRKPVNYMPDGAPAQVIHAEADALVYGTGGRWGRWIDGGGSSLELTDVRADSTQAPAWSGSDESQKSGWTTVEHTGVLNHGMNGVAADYLQVMLLGDGECLVDDIEVIPSGGVNAVPNGRAVSGAAGWNFLRVPMQLPPLLMAFCKSVPPAGAIRRRTARHPPLGCRCHWLHRNDPGKSKMAARDSPKFSSACGGAGLKRPDPCSPLRRWAHPVNPTPVR